MSIAAASLPHSETELRKSAGSVDATGPSRPLNRPTYARPSARIFLFAAEARLGPQTERRSDAEPVRDLLGGKASRAAVVWFGGQRLWSPACSRAGREDPEEV